MEEKNWLSRFHESRDSVSDSLDWLSGIGYRLRGVGMTQLADEIEEAVVFGRNGLSGMQAAMIQELTESTNDAHARLFGLFTDVLQVVRERGE
jgi:hypothetical protein